MDGTLTLSSYLGRKLIAFQANQQVMLQTVTTKISEINLLAGT